MFLIVEVAHEGPELWKGYLLSFEGFEEGSQVYSFDRSFELVQTDNLVVVGIQLRKYLLKCLFADIFPHEGSGCHELMILNAFSQLFPKVLEDRCCSESSCFRLHGKSVLEALHQFFEVDLPVLIFVKVVELNQVFCFLSHREDVDAAVEPKQRFQTCLDLNHGIYYSIVHQALQHLCLVPRFHLGFRGQAEEWVHQSLLRGKPQIGSHLEGLQQKITNNTSLLFLEVLLCQDTPNH